MKHWGGSLDEHSAIAIREAILADPYYDVACAVHDLPDMYPCLSARNVLSGREGWALLILFVNAGLILLLGYCFAPSALVPLLSALALGLFAGLIVWRALLLGVALWGNKAKPTPRNYCAVPDESLPVYTVLIALYDEAAAIDGLADAIRALDWPAEKLDLKLLLEAEDEETIQAVRAATWPCGAEYIILPRGLPQTKPRALNVGLKRARGDFVTIYDAEDRPHPQQLRAAWQAFSGSEAGLACLQAPLDAYNDRASWIAGQWALEYRQQFGLFVPSLARLGLPIPLGGTSNHFRCDVLRALGGWDAWNVTEDADLGMRLARSGYRVDTIAAPTLEEAPESFRVWAAQRSRWIKGFAQTWLVLNRRPREALQDLGWIRWLAAEIILGGTVVSACCHAPLAAWCLLALLLPGVQLPFFAMALLVMTAVVSAVAALAAPGVKNARRICLTLTLCLYWPLQTFAALRAIYELVVAPHLWAKTPHGLTTFKPPLTSQAGPA